MVFTGQKKSSTFAITNAMVNTVQTFNIKVDSKSGIAHVLLDLGLIPVGSGAITLTKLAPFGFIRQLKVTDQAGNQLIALKGYELVLFSFALGATNPFNSLLQNDGTNGWTKISSPATGEEIHAIMQLPIRVGKARNVSELNFEFTFNTLNSTTGLTGVLDFATSFTSVTGSIVVTPIYDDSIVETWLTHIFNTANIGTDFSEFDDPPKGAKIRYALILLPSFWDAQGGTTDDQVLIDQFEFRLTNEITPIALNNWDIEYNMLDFMDSDPHFLMADGSIRAWNWAFVVFPDTVMLDQTKFALANKSSKDARLILLEVQPDPNKQSQSKSFSPAVIKRFFAG